MSTIDAKLTPAMRWLASLTRQEIAGIAAVERIGAELTAETEERLTPQQLPQLCRAFLEATDETRWWITYWRERAWARNELLRCRRRGYLLTVDAYEAVYQITDLLAEVAREEEARR